MFGNVLDAFRRFTNQSNPSAPQPSMIAEAIDANYLAVRKSHLNDSRIANFRNQLVIASKFDADKRVQLFHEDNVFFYFPRYFFKNRNSLFGNITDRTIKGRPLSFTSTTKLWDYQQKAVGDFQRHINQGKTGVFLNAAPGAGKTQMGIEMIRILGCTAMIIVPKKDLIQQWVERIVKTTDIKESEIGTCSSGKINWRGKKIVVGLVHTLVKHRDNHDFVNAFGTILFDECDSSVPPKTFAPAAVMFPAKYRIGMTASEKRADGMEYVFQVNIAEVNIKCEKSNTLDPTVIVCNYNYSSGQLKSCPDRVAMKGMYLNLISKNQHRNHYIADQGAIAYGEGRVTVIMGDRIAQLKDIHSFLVNKFSIPATAIGFYIGSNTRKENKRVADNCKIILATYGMMSRGTDIQRLSTLIIATPRNEMIQVAGRIERALPGKPFPIILDIVDTQYSISRSGLDKRLQYYFSRNLKVLEKTCA